MTRVEEMAPNKLSDVSLEPRGQVFPSPIDWRNEIFYFILPDRFSNGLETDLKLYNRYPSTPMHYQTTDKKRWMEEGKKFQGGTLKGIESKLDYLKGLGITTLWIAPPWKQRVKMDTYHGYGIQNFLEIDRRFGTRQDLRDLVDAAHKKGMHIVLDIIYNHTGDNWLYPDESGNPVFGVKSPYIDPPGRHNFLCWRDKNDDPLYQAPAHIDDGVWPEEFQNSEWYTRAGHISRWDPESWEDHEDDDCPWRRGDFYSLKDLNLNKPEVLEAIIKVYCYWIALSDCDGFRIDTVKHVPLEASRKFCGAIREYAESIGKNSFLLLGEVTGGSKMVESYLDISGKNIDAFLDIGDPAKEMAGVIKFGWAPHSYFDFFTDIKDLGSHRLVGKYHVSILDDHDKVGLNKARFAKPKHLVNQSMQIAQAICIQMTSLGIPCIYYGTEQEFDGNEGMHDDSLIPDQTHMDRYIRESMFESKFGAFETEGCHFFDKSNPTYKRIADLATLRKRNDRIGQTLRFGRLYQRSISYDNGLTFDESRSGGAIVAWSRIHFNNEVLIVMNVDPNESHKGLITIDCNLNINSNPSWLFYNGSSTHIYPDAMPGNLVVHNISGRSIVELELPPSGIAIIG